MIPHLTGREFEDACKFRMDHERGRGRGYMWKCGVQSSFMKGEWKPIKSLPDFEGLAFSRFFVLECKACSQASFSLDDDKFKRRQLRHMLGVDEYGGLSLLALHFNGRTLKRGEEPPETWAIPVTMKSELWMSHDRGETKRITREDCREYGILIEWNAPDGCRVERPDLLAAIEKAIEFESGIESRMEATS